MSQLVTFGKPVAGLVSVTAREPLHVYPNGDGRAIMFSGSEALLEELRQALNARQAAANG